VTLDEDFLLLPPIATTLGAPSAPGASAPQRVPVALEGELTALGTVDLSCVSLESGERFRLAFELRGTEAPPSRKAASSRSSGGVASTRLDEAYEAIQRVFGKGRKDVKEREVKDLLRQLERLLGERPTWSLEVNRCLFDVLGPL